MYTGVPCYIMGFFSFFLLSENNYDMISIRNSKCKHNKKANV